MADRTYVRADDGKFSSTPGGGGRSKPKAKTARKTRTLDVGSTATTSTRKATTRKTGSRKTSAAAGSARTRIAADEKAIGRGTGTISGTINRKNLHKTYSVKVTKGKGGATTRTVTRHSVKLVNGRKRTIDVTRTTTVKGGVTTVDRAVSTDGGKPKTTHTVTGRTTAKPSPHKARTTTRHAGVRATSSRRKR